MLAYEIVRRNSLLRDAVSSFYKVDVAFLETWT
jgi:hypothetical protein